MIRRGVYPGSFNPPTIGHLAIMEAAIAQRDLNRLDLVISRIALGKEAVSRPTLDERVAVLRASVSHLEIVHVELTDHQLLADIAQDADVLVMGADKWTQVNDPVFYADSPAARDDALARLPELAIVPRGADPVPQDHVLDVPEWVGVVSSTAAREVTPALMTAPARVFHLETSAWV